MAYTYTSKSREESAHALPDVEVFSSPVWIVDCVCGDHEIPSILQEHDRHATCPACGETERPVAWERNKIGWWYAFGLPGCLWDGEPSGPYPTEAEALAAAREAAGVCPHGCEDDEPCDACDGGVEHAAAE